MHYTERNEKAANRFIEQNLSIVQSVEKLVSDHSDCFYYKLSELDNAKRLILIAGNFSSEEKLYSMYVVSIKHQEDITSDINIFPQEEEKGRWKNSFEMGITRGETALNKHQKEKKDLVAVGLPPESIENFLASRYTTVDNGALIELVPRSMNPETFLNLLANAKDFHAPKGKYLGTLDNLKEALTDNDKTSIFDILAAALNQLPKQV